MYKVMLTTRLFSRVREWDKESQIRFDAFQSNIRLFGADAVISDYNCSIENCTEGGDGSLDEISFWMKVRVQYEHLTLVMHGDDIVLDV